MVHDHRSVNGGEIRAAIFGVSDGLVSNVALILGVAAAASGSTVLIAGVSGLLAGAASMAAGEYVSMKAQRELLEREMQIERVSLERRPEEEQAELESIYRSRGLGQAQASELAAAVHADPEVALDVHIREELGVDPDDIGEPVRAAVGSFLAFSLGAAVPLVPWMFSTGRAAVFTSVLLGLVAAALVGATIARLTERSMVRTMSRQIGWAVGACVITVIAGSLLGTVV
jgi:VIT1/CCC1 family predicted Fe2+/Mn2+ transporter